MTILEAVKAVPHRDDCAHHQWLAPEAVLALAGKSPLAPLKYACTCDRDERIAKGIEAAFDEVFDHDQPDGDARAVAAFVKVSTL